MTGRLAIAATTGLTLALIFTGQPAEAFSSYVARIPNGSVFGCENCHEPDNAFTTHFDAQGRVWNAALAALDSDDDGFANGVELQDPAGTWMEGQPDPGDPALVTNPGNGGSFPEPTATPTAEPGTATPTPVDETPTPTPTVPAGTATPTPAAGVVLEVFTNLAVYAAGDLFQASISYDNPGSPILVDQYIILDVFGQYFFHPTWTMTLDFTPRTIPGTQFTEEVFLEFNWPAGAGTASGIRFWFAALEPGTVSFVGNYDFTDFGFSS